MKNGIWGNEWGPQSQAKFFWFYNVDWKYQFCKKTLFSEITQVLTFGFGDLKEQAKFKNGRTRKSNRRPGIGMMRGDRTPRKKTRKRTNVRLPNSPTRGKKKEKKVNAIPYAWSHL